MSLDPRYYELNARAAETLRASEAAAVALFDYFRDRVAPASEVKDQNLAERIRTKRRVALDCLGHPDASVRLHALLTLGSVWSSPATAAAAVRRMALADSDREVQLTALAHLAAYQSPYEYDGGFYQALAELATASYDVMLRHSVYLNLCKLAGLYDLGVFAVKYVAYPLVYDEGLVESFLTPARPVAEVRPPPATPRPTFRQRVRRFVPL